MDKTKIDDMRRKKVQSDPKASNSGDSVDSNVDVDQKFQSIMSRIQRVRKRLDNLQTELEDIAHDLRQEEASTSERLDPEPE